MRWKTVALAGAFGPAVLGCNLARNAARTLINEPQVVHTQNGIEHELRRAGRAAWAEVREEYPRKAFTAEFRDGFLDGYVDYLDRGGNGSLPAVPPSKYTRNKKYFTEDGQCLLKDYFLGFKYGQEIAIATNKRQFLTVPVLIPQQASGPAEFTLASGNTHPVPVPAYPPGLGQPTPVTPGNVLPNPKPIPKPGSDDPPPKLGTPPLTVPGNPARLPPAPMPVLPIPPAPTPPGVNPPPVMVVPTISTAPKPTATPKLPPPPSEVPTIPDDVPTPSVLDELPVVPPNRTETPVVPPYRPDEEPGK